MQGELDGLTFPPETVPSRILVSRAFQEFNRSALIETDRLNSPSETDPNFRWRSGRA